MRRVDEVIAEGLICIGFGRPGGSGDPVLRREEVVHKVLEGEVRLDALSPAFGPGSRSDNVRLSLARELN